MGFTRTGRVVLIEAKETKRPLLSVGTRGLKYHQFQCLMECHKAGGIALLCWLHNGVLAVLDPDMIREFTRERRSIPWGKIPERFLCAISRDTEFLWCLEPFLAPGEA